MRDRRGWGVSVLPMPAFPCHPSTTFHDFSLFTDFRGRSPLDRVRLPPKTVQVPIGPAFLPRFPATANRLHAAAIPPQPILVPTCCPLPLLGRPSCRRACPRPATGWPARRPHTTKDPDGLGRAGRSRDRPLPCPTSWLLLGKN